jgi:ketosteroid isomerase-like protein
MINAGDIEAVLAFYETDAVVVLLANLMGTG